MESAKHENIIWIDPQVKLPDIDSTVWIFVKGPEDVCMYAGYSDHSTHSWNYNFENEIKLARFVANATTDFEDRTDKPGFVNFECDGSYTHDISNSSNYWDFVYAWAPFDAINLPANLFIKEDNGRRNTITS